MYVILIAALFFVSATLAGIFTPPFQKGTVIKAEKKEYACCNTGNGKDCKPDRSVPLGSYDGKQYGLLKSNVYLQTLNNAEHYDPGSKKTSGALAGKKIFVNVVPDKKASGRTHEPECKKNPDPGFDWIYGKKVAGDESNRDFGCYRVPDDMLIYDCRSDNAQGDCSGELSAKKARFDVWIRLNEIPNDDIDSKFPSLTQCYKPEDEEERGEKAIVFRPSPAGQDNLQLRTFTFVEPEKPATWLSPYCKPAIYLYPEKKTAVNVQVFPQGKMLLTIPPYPINGWNVIAEPNGNIYTEQNRFDYLYYEASLPDQLITKPEKGFVISFAERSGFLSNLVTKLGLNEKEKQQFLDYWVPILPKSPYYFIGVMPQIELQKLSPVLITPQPDNLIRVTLYFQALDKNIPVQPPILLPVIRTGFTAVEWGGIVKQDKDHPFSCFQ